MGTFSRIYDLRKGQFHNLPKEFVYVDMFTKEAVAKPFDRGVNSVCYPHKYISGQKTREKKRASQQMGAFGADHDRQV